MCQDQFDHWCRLPRGEPVSGIRGGRAHAEGCRPGSSRPFPAGAEPNDLWWAGVEGKFKLGGDRYCYPLTFTDQASSFLLLCKALESVREKLTITAFEQLFAGAWSAQGDPFGQRRRPSPAPMASAASPISVWWLRLGEALEAHQTRPSPSERPP